MEDSIMLFILFISLGLLIAPYIWLFNCSYYLKEIDKKLEKILNK